MNKDENKPQPERTDKTNNYPVVICWLALKWICPFCFKGNNINTLSAIKNSMIDECVQCETAVNLAEPEK